MAFILNWDPLLTLKRIAAEFAPKLVAGERDAHKVRPFGTTFLDILQESGYFHIQATKPDTPGAALLDSPMGLATWILEKFAFWTNKSFRDLADGGLNKEFTLDELLTNVMIYWSTDSITSSMRFYKEWLREPDARAFNENPVLVPTGVGEGENEVEVMPEVFLRGHTYADLRHYSTLPKTGHFAAFQNPGGVAADFRAFVGKVLQK